MALPIAIPTGVNDIVCIRVQVVTTVTGVNKCSIGSSRIRAVICVYLAKSAVTSVIGRANVRVNAGSLATTVGGVPKSILAGVGRGVNFHFLAGFNRGNIVGLNGLMPVTNNLVNKNISITSAVIVSEGTVHVFVRNRTLSVSRPARRRADSARSAAIRTAS